MNNSLADTVIVRAMPGTRGRAKKLLKAFPGSWDSESHFYRAAIFSYENELEVEKFERDLDRAHQKRIGKVRR